MNENTNLIDEHNEGLTPIEELSPFKRIVLSLGTLPSAFYNTMTYYESLVYFYEYLKNEVIPTVNNNGEAVEELQTKYIELKSYVDNYFDNLDVQEEINAKLDEMAEDGSLENLIKNYIDPLYQSYENQINEEITLFKDDINNEISTLTLNVEEDIEEINTKVDSTVSGTPKGAYETISALTTADPDHDYIYVVAEDGKWYYYDSGTSSWTAGGTYQASIDPDSIEELQEEVSRPIYTNKLSGYYNLCYINDAIIYKDKKLAGWDSTTFLPNMQDQLGGTVIDIPVNAQYGDYIVKVGDIPTSGHIFIRYLPNVRAAGNPYSTLLTQTDWATEYDTDNNLFIIHTQQIINLSGSTHFAIYLQNVDEPVVYAKTLQPLDSGLMQLKNFIGEDQLQADLSTGLKNSISVDKADVCLPSTIYTVIGKEHNIYLWNIYKCNDLNNYYTRVGGAHSGNKVKHLGDCIRIIPETTGQFGLDFCLYGYDNYNILTKATTIKKIANTKPDNVKLIMIGDSLVENGSSLAELKNMFGNNLTLYGTRQTTALDSNNVSRTVFHEGRSGWAAKEYLENSTYLGATNAFYNPTSETFDFSYYMTNNPSFNDVTDVIIQLGTNDVNRCTQTEYINNLKTMIESITDYSAAINVYVCVPPPPSNDQYGYGDLYYTHGKYQKDLLFNFGKAIITEINTASIIPIYQNLDCLHDFPTKTVQVSSRNPQTITIASDVTHPSKYGFYKFADTIYCSILGKYSE